jgi:hypothetical protein
MRACLAALLVMVTPAVAAPSEPGTLTLHINRHTVDALGVNVEIEGTAPQPSEWSQGYERWLIPVATSALAGQLNPARSLRGSLQFDRTLSISRGRHALKTDTFELRPRGLHPLNFELLDQRGRVWFELKGGHPQPGASNAVAVDMLSLHASEWLANALDAPVLARALFGGAFLRATSFASIASAPPGPMCPPEQLRWPTLGFQVDVALEEIPDVYTVRCVDCTETSTDGLVAIAPGARLRNVGTADVPWFAMFSGTPAPYGVDQHPFLVWNLYRVGPDGAITQLGASAIKHAFYSSNTSCPCPGAPVLYAEGCTDEYDAFTNDLDRYLAPRIEVLPASGLWARCGSLHDRDCNGVRDQLGGAGESLAQRLVVRENALADSNSRYFVEAWYVTRDDVDIDNSMATLEIRPVKEMAYWAFANVGTTVPGPLLKRLREAPQTGRRLTRVATPNGALLLASTVSPNGDGRYRYQYELLNAEWVLSSVSGTPPNLRLLAATGLERIDVPAPQATASFHVDADALPTTDWSATLQNDQARFVAPAGVSHRWGEVHRFGFISSRGPSDGTIRISAESNATPASADLPALVASTAPSDALFWSSFEN